MFLPAYRIVYGDEQTSIFFVLAFSCHLQGNIKYIVNVHHAMSCKLCSIHYRTVIIAISIAGHFIG